jgi:hypothetical protein
MRPFPAWLHRLTGLFTRARRERKLHAELESHLQLHMDYARAAGLEQPSGGAVAVIQRFGGLVLDGVFAHDWVGVVRFHAARRLTTRGVAEVLAAVEPRIRRLLGFGAEDAAGGGGDPWADETPALAGWRRRCRGPGGRVPPGHAPSSSRNFA